MENKNKILWGSDKNAVIFLIGINLVIFLFFKLMFFIFKNDPETFLQDYTDLITQFGIPAQQFLHKPWTILTYFFSHVGFFNLLSNMVWLFSFSYLLQMVAGNRHVAPSYLYGGLAGGLTFVFTNLFFPNGNIMIMGATTAILSVSATTVAFAPNFRIFPFIKGGIPLWILFVLFLLVDFLSVFTENRYVLPAHLIAAAVGYLYGKAVQKGKDPGYWMHWIYNEFMGIKQPSRSGSRKKLYYKGTVVPFRKEKIVNQMNIDEILDKINQHGMNALTKEEKNFLNKAKDQL